MDNPCHFSPDRRHRYSLVHRWNPLFGDRLLLWIGLNPSTADEAQLDPTLTRIAAFSKREGADGFWMANLFALRTPCPQEMRSAPDPVGPENDASLLAAAARCERIVAAWGASGVYQARADAVVRLLAGRELWCLGTTKDGQPRHPLYVAGAQPLVRWAPQPAASGAAPPDRRSSDPMVSAAGTKERRFPNRRRAVHVMGAWESAPPSDRKRQPAPTPDHRVTQ